MAEVMIAGEVVAPDTIRQVLVDYARRRAGTLRFVDRFARSQAALEPGPVTPDDIVMLNVFAAAPSPDLTVKLLTTSHLYGWDLARMHAPARITDGPEDPVAWARGAGVAALRELFVDVAEGVQLLGDGTRRVGGSRLATASKLLYVRWPDVVPVVDSRLEAVYGQRADKDFDEIPSRIVRRWAAIRQDVISAGEMLLAAGSAAADDLEARTERQRIDAAAAADDLRSLSALRVLDIVVWGRARRS